MKKKSLVTILIILIVIAISIIILTKSKSNSGISKVTTHCIAQNSTLYTQLGCHACKNQEEMFGKNYQYLNVVDCWYERDRCLGIQYTPTWIINGEKYIGVQNIEKLKELTGC